MSSRVVAAAIAAGISGILALGGPAAAADQLGANVSKQLKRMGFSDAAIPSDRDKVAQLELLLGSGEAPQRVAVERLLSQ